MGLHSCYLRDILSDVKTFRKTAAKTVKTIKEQNVEYDYLVGTGLSGSLMVPVLSLRLNKPFCILRKTKEDSHASFDLEGGPTKKVKYLFVDDFIACGDTLIKCIKAMGKSKCIGCMLYHRDHFGFFDIKSVQGEFCSVAARLKHRKLI